MATVSTQDTPRNNGRPASAPAQVVMVRQAAIAAEDAADRMWHRQVPAWVISGGIHLLLMAAFLIGNYFFGGRAEATRCVRRSRARARATSSFGLNGFAM